MLYLDEGFQVNAKNGSDTEMITGSERGTLAWTEVESAWTAARWMGSYKGVGEGGIPATLYTYVLRLRFVESCREHASVRTLTYDKDDPRRASNGAGGRGGRTGLTHSNPS
jgi:hypothetical protein